MIDFTYDHVHLVTPDVEGTSAWYRRILGATESFSAPGVCYLSLGGTTLTLTQTPTEEEVKPAFLNTRIGVDHFGLSVPDLTQAIAHFRDNGVNITTEPLKVRDGLNIAFVEAPDRVRIEIVERS